MLILSKIGRLPPIEIFSNSSATKLSYVSLSKLPLSVNGSVLSSLTKADRLSS